MATELVELGQVRRRMPRTCVKIRKLKDDFVVEIVDVKTRRHLSWLGPGCECVRLAVHAAKYITRKVAKANADKCRLSKTCPLA